MEDTLDVSTKIRLIFRKDAELQTLDVSSTDALLRLHVGQTIALAVVAVYAGKHAHNEIEMDGWRSRVRLLSVHACLSPREAQKDGACPTRTDDNFAQSTKRCPPCSSFVEGLENECICDFKLDTEPKFIDDLSWVIPFSLTLNSLPGPCDRVALNVTVWLADKVHPPGSKALEQLDMILEPNEGILLDDKIVSRLGFSHLIDVYDPPVVDVKLIVVGGKHNLLLKVKNQSPMPVYMYNCKVLPSSCHWATRTPEDPECHHDTKDGTSEESHDNCVTMTTSIKKKDMILFPREELSLLYQLRYQGIIKQHRLSELSLAAHLTWSFSPPKQENCTRVITTYLLPKISSRKPLFVVSASCPHVTEKMNSFAVTYDICNNLQDFLALKLYWSPERALSANQDPVSRQHVERLVESVICHDPCVELGTCPKNTSLSVKVGFQILQPGLFELGTHMKLNLRYALGNHSNLVSPTYSLPSPSITNSDSNATISAEDQLVLESENLWRDRSCSVSSSHSAEPDSIPVTVKRKSFATKSYSFGDLGPTGSGDSTEDPSKVRFKKIERSSAVPPPRPAAPRLLLPSVRVPDPTPSSLMDPGNFLKKTCLIYVPAD
ncbi:trafficking protein particle complex subunit 14-like [Liolophura sinensis]|uniref:trafficking protein particle complex subunit 14-like n=1 Tax=Liolophura sinensis TaxID=3198878 RepID=UPI003159193A